MQIISLKCIILRTVLIEKIKAGHTPYCRPKPQDGNESEIHPGVLTLMKQCWAEEPSERPSFDDIGKSLRTINKGKSVLCSELVCGL